MKSFIYTSGNSGPKVRSDCEVTLELKENEGISIDLISRVKALYGKSIVSLTSEILDFFGIKGAKVTIKDSGALPFVIAARLEHAVKQLISTDLEYLPEFIEQNSYASTHDRFRFSRLYVPGNSPGLMINAGLHSADGVILDLEDSVAPDKKGEARLLVRNALRQVDFYGSERMVRINPGELGMEDLNCIIPHNVNLVLIPKCEDADYIKLVEKRISGLQKEFNLKNKVHLMPIIESALGVENAFNIACASSSIVSLAIGLEDFTADIGVQRTTEGLESLYARTRLVIAAKAAHIQPVDSVFSDVDNMEELMETVKSSKKLGFEGMGCIHPRQIKVIQKGFAPDTTEIEKSKRILLAFESAKQKGMGVITLGSKMIDLPVVIRAQKNIDLAIRLGLLSDKWMDEMPENDN